MKREKALKIAKPIKFRENMIRAIEFGRKTATRRLININAGLAEVKAVGKSNDVINPLRVEYNGAIRFPRYQIEDILCVCDGLLFSGIFIRVTNIRAQRIEEITDDEAIDEGFSSRAEFLGVIFEIYPEATPKSWVWVIEFERVWVE